MKKEKELTNIKLMEMIEILMPALTLIQHTSFLCRKSVTTVRSCTCHYCISFYALEEAKKLKEKKDKKLELKACDIKEE